MGVICCFYIMVFGFMVCLVFQWFGKYFLELVLIFFCVLSEEELEVQFEEISEGGEVSLEFSEVCEVVLVVLEVFFVSCFNQMCFYIDEFIEVCFCYFRFDFNYVLDDDEDMEDEEEEDGGFDDDDEIEVDGGFDDDDDVSWKIRRCVVKVLYMLILICSSGDLFDSGVFYIKVVLVLVKRFDECEENV